MSQHKPFLWPWRLFYFILFIASFQTAIGQSDALEKLAKQGEDYFYKNEYKKALEVFKEVFVKAEKELGKNHAMYATACDNLAFMHSILGSYDKAEPLYLEAKSIRERLTGKNTPEYAQTLINLGDLYRSQSFYPKAEPLYIEAVEILKKVSGESSHEYSLGANNLAVLYVEMDQLKKAEPLFLVSREVWRKMPDHQSEFATTSSNLGSLSQELGEYSAAQKYYEEAREIHEKLEGGKIGIAYATDCNNLGDMYRELRNYEKAEPFFLEAMEIRRRSLGDLHADYAQACHNIGTLYMAMGQYGKAENYLIKSRNIYEKAFGKISDGYAGGSKQLALLYRALGNYQKAESLFKEALDGFAKTLGKNHSIYATTCDDFAGFYKSIEKYNESESLYLEALKIREGLFGKESLTYATSCNNLGVLYDVKGDWQKAEPFLLETLEINNKKLGKGYFSYGQIRNNLAQCYALGGKAAAADSLYRQAKETYQKTVGKNHPDYALLCNNYGLFYSDNGKYELAKPLFDDAKEIQLAQIDQNFKFLSEREQLKYYQSIQFYFHNYAAFAVKYYPKNKFITGDLYNLRLATKGIIFNSMLKTRHKILESGDSSLLQKYDSVRAMRNYLAKVYGMSAQDRAKKNIDQHQLEEQVNGLEKKLDEQTSQFKIKGLEERARTSWQEVKAKLNKNEAAIEIIRVPKKKDTLYIALLLKSTTVESPELVLLKSGKMMEGRSIHYYRNCIQDLIDDTISYNVFWKPIGLKLKGIKKVYFSADGVYHQINLSTLKNPKSGRYLVDELAIQLVGSTRELINAPLASKASKAILFGHPAYNTDSTSITANAKEQPLPGRRGISRYFDEQMGNIPSLPGTAEEVNSISNLLTDHHVPKELYTGTSASEKKIKSIKDPKILHIATHGFFLQAAVSSDRGQYQADENPLLRSGLLLAGCQKNIQSVTAPTGDEDGVLTAYEAMNLYLDETEIVVLSACETGLGEEQNGEGVYGLQRAFLEAGARSMLISLWRVDDTTTQLLMTNFYKMYLQSGNRMQSFIHAQKKIRSKYPQPYYWGAFVMIGD